MYNKADLIYNTNHSFYRYLIIKKFDNLSVESKYSSLTEFSNDLNKFNKLKIQKEKIEKKKNKCV